MKISNEKNKSRPGKFRAKSFLKKLYKHEFNLPYNEVDTATSIAKEIPKESLEKHPEIVQLIEKIVKKLDVIKLID